MFRNYGKKSARRVNRKQAQKRYGRGHTIRRTVLGVESLEDRRLLAIDTYSQNFDGVATGTFPPGWTVFGPGASAWTTTAAASVSAPNSAFVIDGASAADNQLRSPTFTVVSPTSQLTFEHQHNFESTFDGGVLEISIDGGAYGDIIAAGGSFTQGGYSGTISTTGLGNPLEGRSAWVSDSPGFITTAVNLPAATLGKTVQFRWREGTDNATSDIGWFVDNVSLTGVLAANGAVVIDANDDPGSQADDGADDAFLVRLEGSNVVVDVNGSTVFTAPRTSVTSLTINGSSDNDTLSVDSTNGLVAILGNIRFLAGGGTDSLALAQAGGTTHVSSSLFVGAAAGSGRHEILGDDAAQVVEFEGIEPINDNVPAATFTLSSVPGIASLLDAANAINYVSGITNGPTWGRITVDNFEPIEFTNKGQLIIDAGAGSDEINLNNPNTPTDLTTITVDGGDPTAGSDTVIVNGTTGADTVDIEVTGSDSATVTNLGPQIDITAAEHLIYNGQGLADDLTVTTPTTVEYIEYTPGGVSAPGAGLLTFDAPSGPLLPVAFQGISFQGSLTLDDPNGRADLLFVNGTADSDRFTLDSAGELELVAVVPLGIVFLSIPVQTPGIQAAELRGHEEDDEFNIAANHPFSSGLDIEGGDPSASDVLNFNGTGSSPITAALGFATVQQGGAFNLVSFSGIEQLNVDANGNDLDVLGTDGDDVVEAASNAQNTGTVRLVSSVPAIGASPVVVGTSIGDFSVDPLSGDDEVRYLGSEDADDITIIHTGGVNIQLQHHETFFIDEDVETVTVVGGAGDDALTVNNSNGLIDLDNGIVFEGGAGRDSLILTGSNAVDVATYTPGPNPDEGEVIHEDAAALQRVFFTGLEPVIDFVPAADLFVNGTNANNAINYSGPGPNSNGETTGVVSIDGFETIEFANKTNLRLFGLAGDDVFNLNNSTTPDDLTNIFVNGGDPTASDVVIVNGTTGIDTINYTVTGVDSGTVQVNALPLITLATTEQLVINGRTGSDNLTVTTLAGAQHITFTPGATASSASIDFFQYGGGTALLPMRYEDIGGGGSVSFASGGGTQDVLFLNGTGFDDQFNVGTNGDLQILKRGLGFSDFTTLLLHTQVAAVQQVGAVTLRGFAGDDVFNIPGNHPFPGFLGTPGIVIEGGDPSASDVLNFTGSGTSAVSLSFATSTITQTGLGPVSFSGIEILNAVANNALSVAATTTDDDLAVTVYSATSGKVELGLSLQKIGEVQHTVITPVVNYSAITGALTVDLAAGDDTLIVVGNALAQTFNINASLAPVDFGAPYGVIAASRVQIDDLSVAGLDNGTVTWLGTESLQVYGLEGDDLFNFAPTLQADAASSIPVFIDGGDPIGETAGDFVSIIANGNPVLFEAGPESDEGGYVFGGVTARLSYDHIEATGPIIGATSVIVLGTNGDDDITIIARDQSYITGGDPVPAGLDGVRDFTVSVNGGPEILYIDVGGAAPAIGQLHIDGLAGDDDIIIRAPAPNDVGWSMLVEVSGGAPSAGAANEGDRLVVETPGTDTVFYTPTGADTGIIDLDTNANAAIQVIGETRIVIGAIVNADPPINYNSTQPPGIELFEYDGEGGNDTFTIVGTAGADTFVHTPGSALDEGSVRVNNLLGVTYQNLGTAAPGAAVIVNGNGGEDTLAVRGTSAGDFLDVDFNGAGGRDEFTLTTNAGIHTVVAAIGFTNYEVELLEGDDHVSFVGISTATDIDQVLIHGDDSQDLVEFDFNLDNVLVNVDGTRLDATNVLDSNTGTEFIVTGAELLNLRNGEIVAIFPGVDDQNVRVEASPNPNGGESDRITSSTFPTIDVEETGTLQIFGSDTITVTFVTGSLGATDNYQAVLVGNGTLVIEGRDGVNDSYTIARDGVGSTVVDDNLNPSGVQVELFGSIGGLLRVNGLGGNDTLEVDNTNGLVDLINTFVNGDSGIFFAGGDGNDTLRLTGTTPVDLAEYNVGTHDDEGQVAHTIFGGGGPDTVQRVFFSGLEPVVDVVIATDLDIDATNGDNAINYTGDTEIVGNGPINTGVVSIDNFETYEFANKASLIINALAGDDVINLNNPNTPAGLTDITVNGGDPTASDTVIVNGTAGVDNVTIDQLTTDGARVAGLGPTIVVATTEHLIYDGGGDKDQLNVITPSGSHEIQVFAGTTPDRGEIAIASSSTQLLAIGLENVDVGNNDALLTFSDVDGGRADELVYSARDFSNSIDRFSISSTGLINLEEPLVSGTNDLFWEVATLGIRRVTLVGLGGDDIFNIAGDHPFTQGIVIDGGDPSASDVLNFTGSATVANLITINYENQTIQEAGFGAVSFSGVEILNVNANGHDLTIQTTSGDDYLEVTPTTDGGITAQLVSAPVINTPPVVNATDIGTFLVSTLAGSDDLKVVYTQFAETIFITPTAVSRAGLETVNYVGVVNLQVFGQAGDDIFNVTPSLAATYFIDGGDPIGSTPGDRIVVVGGSAFTPEPGPENDEGSLRFALEQRVSFDHIESLVLSGDDCALIVGTNGDDDITIIQRDATYDPLADGVQDFTVSINGGLDILFIDVAELHVDALAGDDDVVIRTLNQAAVAQWGMEIELVGGSPAAATGDQGDVFELETAGLDSVLYSPNGAGTGLVLLDSDGTSPGLYTAGTDTLIRMVSQFIDPCGLPYISSEGGFEQFVYDGESGDDVLTVVGNQLDFVGGETPNSERFTHTPGAAPDAGSVGIINLQVQETFLGVTYENLGLTGLVNIYSGGGGAPLDIDTLVIYGTGDSDTLDASFVTQNWIRAVLTDGYGQHVAVESEGIPNYELRLLEGDDVINLDAPLDTLNTNTGLPGTFAIFAGGPSGSDVLNLHGEVSVVEDVVIAPDSTNPLDQDITGLGAQIDVSGVELITYFAEGQGPGPDDTLTLIPGAGDHTVRVDNASRDGWDRAVSDALPQVEFTGVQEFIVDVTGPATGANTVTFVTGALEGAQSYRGNMNSDDTLVIEGADGAADDYRVELEGVDLRVVDLNSGVVVRETDHDVGFLRVLGLGGDDFLNVRNSSGVVNVGAIHFAGGDGNDELLLDGVLVIASAQYFVGTHDDEGEIVHVDLNDAVQRVQFSGLEPVTDIVGAANLEIFATHADNAINYTGDTFVIPNDGGDIIFDTGVVSIDNFEIYEFAFKQNVTIFGLAGSDVINLNNPTTPENLTGSITVDGGDPTASDTLVVNSVAGVNDELEFTPTAQGAGTVVHDGVVLPVVNFLNIEHLTLALQQADGDEVEINGTAGNDQFEYTPGATLDTGLFNGTMDFGGPTFPLVPTTVVGASVGGDWDVNVGGAGVDTFIFNGTAFDDTISVDTAGGGDVRVINTINDFVFSHIDFFNMASGRIRGLDGDDVFNHAGDVDVELAYEGNGPSGSDALFITGAANTAETVTITPDGNPLAQDITGLGAHIDVNGVELIRYEGVDDDAGAEDDTLIVYPGAGDHFVRVANVTGFGWDGITSDILPDIHTRNLDTLSIQGGFHFENLEATFALADLDSANNYTFDGDFARDKLIVEGRTSAADEMTVTNPNNGDVAVTSNGRTVTNTENLGELLLRTLGGDDLVIVDVDAAGSDLITVPMTYDGGTGEDFLIVAGTPTVAVTSTTYSPGGNVEEGRLTYMGGGQMIIDFTDLEPVLDLVPSASLVVNATNANNAINYIEGPNSLNTAIPFGGAVTGLVSVDGFETIEFANKAQLVINGLAGDDVTNLNHPTSPTGLNGITVNGGDPTASDLVIVNGTTAGETIVYSPTSINSGTVQVPGLPLVSLFTVEHLTINGLSGDDDLNYVTPATATDIVFRPGATFDSGTVTAVTPLGAAGTDLLPVNFIDIADLNFSKTGGGRADHLTVHATDDDDLIEVFNTGVVHVLKPNFAANATVGITTAGVSLLRLSGQEGDDLFAISGDHPFTAGIFVEGGNPSASDVLNFAASAGGAVTVDLEAQTVTQTGFGAVSYSGIEIIELSAGGAAATTTILGTAHNDDLTVTVETLTAGEIEVGYAVQQNGQVAQTVIAPHIFYSNLGTPGLAVDLEGGVDTLVVVGNALDQNWDVDAAALSVTLDDVPNGVGDDGLITFTTDVESLAVFGLEGNDAFTVNAGPIPVFVDGGDPIGTVPGDSITVNGAIGLVWAGPEIDEGGFLTQPGGTVSFDHIEGFTVVGNDCPFLIIGTNADDDITVIARDSSTHVGADGVRDFTVSINQGPDVLFIDTPDLYIDALSGDDDIVIRAPAPNDADWNVHVRVAGGPPSMGEPNDGDRLVFETPGQDNLIYTPTGPDTGTLLVEEGGVAGVFDSTDTLIEIGPFLFVCVDIDDAGQPIIDLTYISSPGGVELVEYDGELFAGLADDNIFINGTYLDDTTTVSPTGVGPGGSGQGSFVSPGSPLFNFRGYNDLTVNGGPAPIATGSLIFAYVDTSSSVTSDDSTLSVLGNDGTTVIESDDNDGSTTGASAVAGATVATPGSVYFNVGAVGGATIVPYQLFQVIAAPTDTAAEFEPNNTPALATPVTATIMTGTVPDTTGAVDDIDFYAVFVPAGSHLVVIVDEDPDGGGATDTDLTLFDIDGVTLLATGDNDDAASGTRAANALAFTVAVSGIYYIRIADDGSADTGGEYRFVTIVAPISAQLNEIEPNNTAATANPLGAGHFGVGSVSPGGDVNFWVVGGAVVGGLADASAAGFDSLIYNATEGPDVITSDADTIFLAGTTVTLGASLDRLNLYTFGGNDNVDLDLTDPALAKTIDVGAGNDVVNLSGSIDADIFGGDGDDVIVGSPAADNIFGGAGNDTINGDGASDRIYGGSGNDVLIGAGGDDFVYGEDGNDSFGDPAVADPASNDPGNDYFSGGDGSDLFTWDPGDGNDIWEGGAGSADRLQFNGSAAVENFNIFAQLADPSRAVLFRSVGSITIDMADVEEINVTPNGGADNITIGRDNTASVLSTLNTTQVRVVDVNLINTDAAADNVFVDGLALDDNLLVSDSNGVITVAGLPYDVKIRASVVAEGDRLTVRGNEGNDEIKAEAGVEATIAITLDGGSGNDYLSADAILIGGAGNDYLVGGAGVDSYQGGAGDDILVVSPGADTMSGGTGFDIILYQGTEAGETLDLDQVGTTITVSGLIAGTIDVSAADLERIDINGEGGDDTIGVLTGLALPIIADGGEGDDTISGSATVTGAMTIFGGNGNDNITGGNVNDTIYGGFGNDTINGGAGIDDVYGEAGNDAMAGGAGADLLHGGEGVDTFTWNPGDGSDVIDGGDDQGDILIFNGTAGVADTISVSAAANATQALVNLGAATVSLTGVEQFNINGLSGADTINIADLTPTEVKEVNVDLGAADGAADNVNVEGRTTDDHLDITTLGGTVDVVGLRYDIDITSATTADRLTVNANEGNDYVKAWAGVEAVISITLNGEEGNDYLSADAILNGGAGNDTLIGGAGNDTLNGNAGEDTMIGGGGQDTYDGGADYDTIVVNGTSGADRIDVAQTAAGTLEYTVIDQFNAPVENATGANADTISNVEQVQVNAGQGADIIRVRPADLAVTDISLRYTVDGGADGTSDRLAVTDEGLADTFVYRKSELDSAGTITVGAANTDPDPGVDGFLAPLIVFTNIERIDPRVAGVASTNFTQGTVVVFKHDPYEYNDDLFGTIPGNPTHLGANTTINVDPNIDPGADAGFSLPSDVDYYRLEAEYTGTLDVQVFFRQVATLASTRAGLPNNGNLDISVLDANGNVIAGFGANDANDNERVRIPAVAGQIYYLGVFANGTAINNYTITTINHAAPVPFDIELLDTPVNTNTNPVTGAPGATAAGLSSDTGRSQFDNTTFDNDPTILIRVPDVLVNPAGFPAGTYLSDVPFNGSAPGASIDEEILIPFVSSTATDVPGTSAGFRVAVFITETNTNSPVLAGYAQPVTGQPGTFTFTFANDALAPDGSYYISSRVEIIDPAQAQQAQGFGDFAQSLEIVVDTVPPTVFFGSQADADDGLIPDPGVTAQPTTFVDNKTNDTTPTFWGTAEANSIIRVYADLTPTNGVDNFDVLIGLTVALPFDGTNQYPNGQWTVTSTVDLNDPLFGQVDGLRRLLVTAEDLAGNINPGTGVNAQAIEIFIDTQGPQVTGVFVSQSNLVGLGTGNTLLRFASDNPTKIISTVNITGLTAGDVVVGIDLRPADNKIYAVVDGTASDRIYTVNPFTGAATLVATLSTNLSGTNFAVDFNPMADRIRVVSDNGQNLRIVPTTGAVTTDAALNGGTTNATAGAYTNNGVGAASTSLYVINTTTDQLFLQSPPNNGTTTLVGALGVDATAINGFDIAQGTNTAYAALTVGGVSQLYTINLTTGAATLVGSVGTGTTQLRGLTALAPYDLFDPKPSTDGPTPLVKEIVVRVQDLPARVTQFLNPAINAGALNPGLFHVVGDANGIIAIQTVTFVGDPVVVGQPATGTLRITFVTPLPDDRFTLTLSDGIVDDVGNALDGESNASEPQETPLFPSGNHVPGGDFIGRFTVDTRPELSVYAAGSVYVDTNGNFYFDTTNTDATNRDITYTLGFTSDNILAGNFSLAGANSVADGFAKLAAYGRYGGAYRWLIDNNNDGVVDLVTTQTLSPNSLPVAGNFDGNVVNGDEVGLFTGTSWVLDTNHDYVADTTFPAATTGLPAVGDFDGDGLDDFALWRDDQFFVDLASNGFGQIDNSFYFGFIGTREQPIAGDYDRDGIDDLGLWVPDRSGVDPTEGSEWYLLISGGTKLVGFQNDATDRVVTDPQDTSGTRRIVNFTPVPFGNDLYARYGDDFAVPLFGNFDPPVAGGAYAPPAATSLAFKNATNSLDVNGDGHITNIDAFLIIAALRSGGEAALPRMAAGATVSAPYVDTTGDSNLTNLDAFLVISHLRTVGESEGEGESFAPSITVAAAQSTTPSNEETSPVLPLVALASPLSLVTLSNSTSRTESEFAAAVDAVLLEATLAATPKKKASDEDSLDLDVTNDFDSTLDDIAGELTLEWSH